MAGHSNEGGRGNVDYYDAMADAYELFFQDPVGDRQREGERLDAILRRPGIKRVLDAGCGTGRHAIPLAQRGYQVTAIDPSRAMLARAIRAAEEVGVDIHYERLAFEELPGRFAPFDAVISAGNCLGNLSCPADVLLALSSLRACLRAGGLCLIGIKDYDAVRREFRRLHGHGVRDREGTRSILFEVWDLEEPYLRSTAFLLEGRTSGSGPWSVHTERTVEYMLGEAELQDIAGHAGFRTVQRLVHPHEAWFRLET